MIYDHLLVRYGELTLKGANRKTFVSQLRSNVKRALMPLKGYEVKANRDRMYIQLQPEAEIEEMIARISKVYGVHSISPVLKIEKTMEAMYEHAIKFADQYNAGDSFKVEVKRSDKQFEYETFGIQTYGWRGSSKTCRGFTR